MIYLAQRLYYDEKKHFIGRIGEIIERDEK
jgi:hypothetical protein